MNAFPDENDLQTAEAAHSSYFARVWHHGATAVAARHHYTRVGSLDDDEIDPRLELCIDLQCKHAINLHKVPRDPDIPKHSVLEIGPDEPGATMTCFCDQCKISYTYTV